MCLNEHNASVCECVEDKILKEYTIKAYELRNTERHDKFVEKSKEECLDDSWF